jgi:hypothetical protein
LLTILNIKLLNKLNTNLEVNNTMQSPTTNSEPKLGFTRFAEIWNGRLAMIGFVAAILVEMATGQGILGQLGLM